jgi:tRNA nucleotidyltransferase (CCA-adding enzyme)
MKPKFYIVGGYNRDILMHRESNDIDWVVVGATPEWMLANGYKQVGADFPVFLNEDGVEHALARTERKTGAGYHGFATSHDPSVTLEDDLRRRDFTMNAIAFDPETKEYFDPFNGREDIENNILRHVSEAFREDPVRVLRLARFCAQFPLKFTIHETTVTFCKEMVEAGELKHLTKERIWKEFEKALNAWTVGFFNALVEVNAMKVVFPIFNKHVDAITMILCDINRGYFENNHYLSGGNSDAIKKFAAIMTMFNPTTVEKFCEEYRVPNEFKEYALFHSKIARKITMNHFRSPRMIVEMLNELGIYRGNHVMLEAPWKAPYLAILKSAYQRTKHVNFASLTEEQQKTLKGKEIRQAINELRQKILD